MSVPSLARPVIARALAIVACAMPLTIAAQSVHPTPSPIIPVSWGTSADTVIAHASEVGWHFIKVDEDGDYLFDATVAGERAVAYASFGKRGLSRLVVSVAPHPEAELTYQQLSDTLRASYGFERLASGDERGMRAAPGLLRANAWQGILMGLRQDGWITVVFTCPESSPLIPRRPDGLARA